MKVGIELTIEGCRNCPFRENYREGNWSMDMCSLLPGPNFHSVEPRHLNGAPTRPDCPLCQAPGPAQPMGGGATWRLLKKKTPGVSS